MGRGAKTLQSSCNLFKYKHICGSPKLLGKYIVMVIPRASASLLPLLCTYKKYKSGNVSFRFCICGKKAIVLATDKDQSTSQTVGKRYYNNKFQHFPSVKLPTAAVCKRRLRPRNHYESIVFWKLKLNKVMDSSFLSCCACFRDKLISLL